MKSIIGMALVLTAVGVLPSKAHIDDPVWAYDEAAAIAEAAQVLHYPSDTSDEHQRMTYREWGRMQGIGDEVPFSELQQVYHQTMSARNERIFARIRAQEADEVRTRPAAIAADLERVNRILGLRSNTSYEAAVLAMGLFRNYLDTVDDLESSYVPEESVVSSQLAEAAGLGITVPEGASYLDVGAAIWARNNANSPNSGAEADRYEEDRNSDSNFGITSRHILEAKEHAREQLSRWGF